LTSRHLRPTAWKTEATLNRQHRKRKTTPRFLAGEVGGHISMNATSRPAGADIWIQQTVGATERSVATRCREAGKRKKKRTREVASSRRARWGRKLRA
jgi:hypothetical protein